MRSLPVKAVDPTLKQIAADFGISELCLTGWLEGVNVEAGMKPGTTAAEDAELSELPQPGSKHVRLGARRAAWRPAFRR